MDYLWQTVGLACTVNLLLLAAWLMSRAAFRKKHRVKVEQEERDAFLRETSSATPAVPTVHQVKFEQTFFSSNYTDFGAIFISALLIESGAFLIFYFIEGPLYYLGMMLVFSGVSSFVWIFSEIATSIAGPDEVFRGALTSLTTSSRSSSIANKALETSQAAIALSHEALGIAATDTTRAAASVKPEPIPTPSSSNPFDR